MLQSWCTFFERRLACVHVFFLTKGLRSKQVLEIFYDYFNSTSTLYNIFDLHRHFPNFLHAHETMAPNWGWQWDRNAFSVFISSLDFKSLFVPIEATSGSVYCCKYRIVYYTAYSSYSSVDNRQFIWRWNRREFWLAAKNTPIGPVPSIVALNHACTYSWL